MGFSAAEETIALLVEEQRWLTENTLVRDGLWPHGSSPRSERERMQGADLPPEASPPLQNQGIRVYPTSATEHLPRSPSLHKEQAGPPEGDNGGGHGASPG